MKLFKTFLSFVLVVMCIVTITLPVSAQEKVYKIGNRANKLLSDSNYNESLAQVLTEAWDKYETTVKLSKLKIKSSKFIDMYLSVTEKYPEYFYVDSFNTSYSVNAMGYVVDITIGYYHSPRVCDSQRKELETVVLDILSKMERIDREEDKIVFLHDYISAHNAYDSKGVTGNVNLVDDYSFTAYGCLVDGVSVCQGMSDAFMLVCNRAGLTADMALSDDMVHAWNFVKIGDEYYHLDITWNDSASEAGLNYDGRSFLDVKGFASHKYFVKSDDEMLNLDHHSWEQTYLAKDSVTYKDYYWSGVYSQIFIIKGHQYFIKDSKLIKRNFNTGAEEILFEITDSQFSYEGKLYNWNSKSTILAYNYKDNFLLMNLSDGVYAYNLYSGDVSKVHDYNQDGYIGGIVFDNDVLSFDTIGVVNNKLAQLSSYKESISLPEYSVIYGDVDENSEFEISDLLKLRKFMANEGETINEFSADVNEDNRIDLKDLLIMIKKLAGYNIEFGGNA